MKKIALFCIAFLALPILAFAQVKIAVIDMQKVFSDYDKTKIMQQKLNEQLAIYKDHASKLQKEYQALQKECEALQNDAQSVLLSDAERENRNLKLSEKVQLLRQKAVELAEYNKSRDAELKRTFSMQKDQIVAEIKVVVQNKCVLEGWTLVLDMSGVTLNDLPGVIYYSPSMDITASVLSTLNREFRAGKKKEKSQK